VKEKTIKAQRRRFLRECVRAGGSIVLSLISAPVWAQRSVFIHNIRVSVDSDKTRIVFDTNGPAKHAIFSLHEPERVVIDLNDTTLSDTALGEVMFAPSIIRNIRHASRKQGDLRLVLDLDKRAAVRSFLLPPTGRFGHRLVIDLYPQQSEMHAPVLSTHKPEEKLRDVIIAIDAGHGGKDPGAIGRRGTNEKDVVLAIARQLQSLVKGEWGMRAVMTRTQDVYLPLRSRIKYARKHQADLFISIHADASKQRLVRGASVYVLSENGASSEAARWLAERENAADLLGGVSLDDKDDLLAKVLLDLSQTATIEASMDLGKDMLRELERIGRMHSERVEQAGFAVLKSPDVPSVLVETAFISNTADEKRLRKKSYQQAIAKSLLRGIRNYFKDNAPPDTFVAQLNRTRHVIQKGDTLSAIAQRYAVDVKQIRAFNALSGDRIRVGQVLLIPTSDS
jgi:N-acetylmuramoyl-L-alanine amidase